MRRSERLADKKVTNQTRSNVFQMPTQQLVKKSAPAKKRATGQNKTSGNSNKVSQSSVFRSREASAIRHPEKPATFCNITPRTVNVPHYQMYPVAPNHYPGIIMTQSNEPVHPDVKFKNQPFYPELGELVKPTSLRAVSTQYPTLENNFMFYLSPKQADTIAISRYRQPGSNKVDHYVQVILRFCLHETSQEQNDYIPPDVKIKVNGTNLSVPQAKYISRDKPKEGPMKPIDITELMKLSPTVGNWISISCPYDFGRKYVVGVYLVRKLAHSDLIHQLKAKGVRHPDYSRAMIKEKLLEDADSEIATTSLRVSLNCPLGKMRMSIPCRASTCAHLQCFDSGLYLQMNDCRPRWVCPVCNGPATYDCLVIDGYFQQVLASEKLLANVSEIQLLPDGSWENLLPKKDCDKIKSLESEVLSDCQPNSTVVLDATQVQDENKADKNLSVVDLVSSDEEDSRNPDEPLGAKSCKIRKISSSDVSQEKSSGVIVIDLD
ncbi:E3 SUMO-protein ligase PIAS2-like [Cotesia glomerata]|uniref:Uncharacterized protein n=1 Tax=Cotesia glomerata TaxID=32391 RepID=A0AAV7HL98_COTGL|nr:E3 SUMO-protein ligase PIAS2-like [Cotesia glomerata]KAH0540616.1 hypothetical protein KQX54_018553 [Cotesia glomerata]